LISAIENRNMLGLTTHWKISLGEFEYLYSINLAYIGKGVFTTLKSAFHPFTRGGLVMGLQMPLDVLLQVLFSTYLTLNILMARLAMSPQIFNICKHLHAAWFTTQYLHIVQFNCEEKNLKF